MIDTEHKPYVIDAGYIFPPSLSDSWGVNTSVHLFREVKEHIDITYLDSDFNGMGQYPYRPGCCFNC